MKLAGMSGEKILKYTLHIIWSGPMVFVSQYDIKSNVFPREQLGNGN